MEKKTTGTAQPECTWCVFFVEEYPDGSHIGTCRFNPPVFTDVKTARENLFNGIHHGNWPLVAFDGWCREFTPKDDDTPGMPVFWMPKDAGLKQ